MTDDDKPVLLPVSSFRRKKSFPGGDIYKIKRGGTGSNGNSGNAKKRFYGPGNGLRNPKKPGKHGGGTLIPKPPRAAIIWDPNKKKINDSNT